MTRRLRLPIVVTLLLAGVAPAFAQAPAGRGGGAPQIQVNSPELLADRPDHVPDPRAASPGRPPQRR